MPAATRELIRRADLGTSHVIELPVHRFLATRPGWQDLDEKLRQAQSELAAGNSGDAVTDTGTGLQMLFDHLGLPRHCFGRSAEGRSKGGRVRWNRHSAGRRARGPLPVGGECA